jgi:hypothetical protein
MNPILTPLTTLHCRQIHHELEEFRKNIQALANFHTGFTSIPAVTT